MALAYLDHAIDYAQLLRLLKIKPHGAPATNIRLLANLSFTVVYSQTNMAGLEAMLQQSQPVIVFVRTGALPYWAYNTDHALVVVGYDENHLFVNDPHHAESPTAVPRDSFELAWQERDYYYALITR
jgi:ABC-type bacteriocin/lantibiotic exporter with double-glycine peptidase domain